MIRTAGLRRVLVGLFFATVLLLPRAAQADSRDFPIPNGHFFKQTNGAGGAGDTGYSVNDADQIPFWTVYERLGGPSEIGYPISRRFTWNGVTSQAFQMAVLQWNQQTQSVVFLNLLDELSRAGRDPWLAEQAGIPGLVDFQDTNRPWDQIVQARLAILDSVPNIRERYQHSVDPLAEFGLPTSRVEVRDDVRLVRFQRAVIVESRRAAGERPAGTVRLLEAGELARAAGLWPGPALALEVWTRPANVAPAQPSQPAQLGQPSQPSQPAQASQPAQLAQSAPPSATAPDPPAVEQTSSLRTLNLAPLRAAPQRADRRAWRVALDPGHGGAETGATRPMGDGLLMVEKNINLYLALRLADLLRRGGVEVALTRDTDRGANWPGYDLNGDGRVDISDDLQVRAEIANRFGADLFVSIHNNGHNNPAQFGTEVYYNAVRTFADRSRVLAWYLDQRIVQLIRVAGYPTQDRGMKTDLSAGHGGYFAVLGPQTPTTPSPSRMPAALTESLFVSSYYDGPWLARTEILDAIARGHAEGILDYLEWSNNQR